MKSTFVALGLAALGLLWTRGAAAQEETFGTKGRFIIAGERLVGYTVTKTEYKWEVGNGDRTEKYTDTHFDFTAKGNVNDPFTAPRLAFDYFIIDALSLGGAIGYSSHTREGKWDQPNNDGDFPDETENGFVIAPRVGYCYMFSPVVGIWPRGGFTYWSLHREVDAPGNNDTEDNGSGLNFSLEAMLAIAPVPHAAFLVGPTLDFPLTGSGEHKEDPNPDLDIDKWKYTTYGIQAGVGVWF